MMIVLPLQAKITIHNPLIMQETGLMDEQHVTPDAQKEWGAISSVDALNMFSNIHVVSTNPSALYGQGTENNHTQVILDGLTVSDPSNTKGAFDLVQLGNTKEHVIDIKNTSGEGYLGPQIALHIPQAYKTQTEITFEGGARDHFEENLTHQHKAKNIGIFAACGHSKTQGMPSLPVQKRTALVMHQSEPSRNTTNALRFDINGPKNWSMHSTHRSNEQTSNYLKTFGTPSLRQNHGKFQLHQITLERQMTQNYGTRFTSGVVRQTRLDCNDHHPDARYAYHSTTQQNKWDQTFKIIPAWLMDVGMSHQQQTFKARSVNITDGTIGHAMRDQYQISVHNTHYLHPKLTCDHRFALMGANKPDKKMFPWSLGTRAQVIDEHLFLHTRRSTLVQLPSLYQLQDTQYGNQKLKYERNNKNEVGVTLQNKRLSVGITYFTQNITQMIDFMPQADGTWRYENTDKLKIKGIENYLSASMTQTLQIFARHTFTHAKNQVNILKMRRPMHQIKAGVKWKTTEDLTLTLSVLHDGKTRDLDRLTLNPAYTRGPFLLKSTANYVVNKNWRLFTRFENMLNKTYQMPLGYQQPKFSTYAGVSYRT